MSAVCYSNQKIRTVKKDGELHYCYDITYSFCAKSVEEGYSLFYCDTAIEQGWFECNASKVWENEFEVFISVCEYCEKISYLLERDVAHEIICFCLWDLKPEIQEIMRTGIKENLTKEMSEIVDLLSCE